MIKELESGYEQRLSDLRVQKRLMKVSMKAGNVSEKDYSEIIAQIRNIESIQAQNISQMKLEVFGIPELASVLQNGDEDQFYGYVLKNKELS